MWRWLRVSMLDQVEEHVIAMLLAIMTVTIFVNVLSRYLFHWGIAFSYELVSILFLWSTMLGTAAGFRRDAHMGVGMASEFSPPAVIAFLRRVSQVAALVFFSFLAALSYQAVQVQARSGQITPSLGWPEWTASVAMPVGSVLILVRVLQVVLRDWRGRRREDPPTRVME